MTQNIVYSNYSYNCFKFLPFHLPATIWLSSLNYFPLNFFYYWMVDALASIPRLIFVLPPHPLPLTIGDQTSKSISSSSSTTCVAIPIQSQTSLCQSRLKQTWVGSLASHFLQESAVGLLCPTQTQIQNGFKDTATTRWRHCVPGVGSTQPAW